MVNFASLLEGGSGAAYSDENGMTVSLMARQFEMPREYVSPGSDYNVLDTSGITATSAT